MTQKQENTEKISIRTTSKADLNVLERTDSQPTDNLKQRQNVTKPTEERNIPTININNLLILELKQEITLSTEFYTPNIPKQTPTFFDDSTHLGNVCRSPGYTTIRT